MSEHSAMHLHHTITNGSAATRQTERGMIVGSLVLSDVTAASWGASVQPGARSAVAWIEPDGLTRFEDVPGLDGAEETVELTAERWRSLFEPPDDT